MLRSASARRRGAPCALVPRCPGDVVLFTVVQPTARQCANTGPSVAGGRPAGTSHVRGRTSQARFLAALEAGELLVGLQGDPSMTLESYLEARSALARMLDPRATGAFAVLAFGRDLAPDAIRGFG